MGVGGQDVQAILIFIFSINILVVNIFLLGLDLLE